MTEHATTECLLFPGIFDRPVVAKFGRFGDEARHRRRAGMLNPQHPVTKGNPDSVSLTPKQLRPQRVIVHNQNLAGQRLQLSDCVGADLLLGERATAIEWVSLFRHFC